MKLIKITRQGSIHFKLSDGRIGTVSESGYVRVSTKYDNYYHKKPLFYQINKQIKYKNKKYPEWTNVKRELVPNHVDRIKLLYTFNQKNCKQDA